MSTSVYEPDLPRRGAPARNEERYAAPSHRSPPRSSAPIITTYGDGGAAVGAVAAGIATRGDGVELPAKSDPFYENRTIIVVIAFVVVLLILIIAWLALRGPRTSRADARSPGPPFGRKPDEAARTPEGPPARPAQAPPAPGTSAAAPTPQGRGVEERAPASPQAAMKASPAAPQVATAARRENRSAYQEIVRTTDDDELALYANIEAGKTIPRASQNTPKGTKDDSEAIPPASRRDAPEEDEAEERDPRRSIVIEVPEEGDE
jgi:hypothetical protein